MKLTFLQALRKKLCKNNQPQKNDFVVRAADRSLYFLFQYKLNTAVCQAHRALCPSPEAALSISWIFPVLPEPLKVLYRSEIRSSACSDGDSRC